MCAREEKWDMTGVASGTVLHTLSLVCSTVLNLGIGGSGRLSQIFFCLMGNKVQDHFLVCFPAASSLVISSCPSEKRLQEIKMLAHSLTGGTWKTVEQGDVRSSANVRL